MNKYLPVYVDDLFMLSILLLFLVINYNLPLSSIYSHAVHISLVMYLVPVMFNLFKWIPLSQKGNRLNELLAGIASGAGFIYFYNSLKIETPMAAVFATTAFGQSESVGKFVFGVLIPTVETILFFVIIISWLLWKVGKSVQASKFTDADTTLLGLFASGIFTIFHATAKGLSNNIELLATFAFAVMSIALVLYFKSAMSAIIAHIVVNGYSIDLLQSIWAWVQTMNLWVMAGIGVGVYYFLIRKNRRFISTA